MRASFEVDGHVLDVYWSLLGYECYRVDGEIVLSQWNFSLRGTRTLTIGEGECQHQVEFRVDMAPALKSWFFPIDWVAEVYVDGERIIDDLTPKARQWTRFFIRLTDGLFLILLSILLVIVMIG